MMVEELGAVTCLCQRRLVLPGRLYVGIQRSLFAAPGRCGKSRRPLGIAAEPAPGIDGV